MAEPRAIVLIDDDRDFLEMNASVLASRGYAVRCFSDPQDALAAIRSGEPGSMPSLVITDLMMKTIDAGFSFSRLINFDPRFKGVPIILITAAAKKRGFALQAQNVKDLQKMGIDGYFDKPVDPDQLLRKVRELLAREPTLP